MAQSIISIAPPKEEEEDVRKRLGAEDYANILSTIGGYKGGLSQRGTGLRRLVGMGGSLSLPKSSGSTLSKVMELDDETLQAEINKRMYSAIESGQIKNISDWNDFIDNFDPVFAEKARTAFRSYMAERGAETTRERADVKFDDYLEGIDRRDEVWLREDEKFLAWQEDQVRKGKVQNRQDARWEDYIEDREWMLEQRPILSEREREKFEAWRDEQVRKGVVRDRQDARWEDYQKDREFTLEQRPIRTARDTERFEAWQNEQVRKGVVRDRQDARWEDYLKEKDYTVSKRLVDDERASLRFKAWQQDQIRKDVTIAHEDLRWEYFIQDRADRLEHEGIIRKREDIRWDDYGMNKEKEADRFRAWQDDQIRKGDVWERQDAKWNNYLADRDRHLLKMGREDTEWVRAGVRWENYLSDQVEKGVVRERGGVRWENYLKDQARQGVLDDRADELWGQTQQKFGQWVKDQEHKGVTWEREEDRWDSWLLQKDRDDIRFENYLTQQSRDDIKFWDYLSLQNRGEADRALGAEVGKIVGKVITEFQQSPRGPDDHRNALVDMNERLQAAGETDVGKLNEARVYFEGIYPSKADSQSKEAESKEAMSVYNQLFPYSTPGIFDADQTRKRPDNTPTIEEWIRSEGDYDINGVQVPGWQKYRSFLGRESGVVDQQAATTGTPTPVGPQSIAEDMSTNFKKYIHEEGRPPQVVYNAILQRLQQQLELGAMQQADFDQLKAQLDEQMAAVGQ